MGFLHPLAVRPSGQMSGEAIPTALSFLLAGLGHDLVSGACFPICPCTTMLKELGTDLMMVLGAWGYKACRNVFSHSLLLFPTFPSTNTCRAVEFRWFSSVGEGSFRLLYGNHHSS